VVRRGGACTSMYKSAGWSAGLGLDSAQGPRGCAAGVVHTHRQPTRNRRRYPAGARRCYCENISKRAGHVGFWFRLCGNIRLVRGVWVWVWVWVWVCVRVNLGRSALTGAGVTCARSRSKEELIRAFLSWAGVAWAERGGLID